METTMITEKCLLGLGSLNKSALLWVSPARGRARVSFAVVLATAWHPHHNHYCALRVS